MFYVYYVVNFRNTKLLITMLIKKYFDWIFVSFFRFDTTFSVLDGFFAAFVFRSENLGEAYLKYYIIFWFQ